MVCFNGVDDFLGFLVFPCDFNAQLYMGAFHFVGESLADVVEKTCALGNGAVHAQFICDGTCQQSNFNGVSKDVLTE